MRNRPTRDRRRGHGPAPTDWWDAGSAWRDAASRAEPSRATLDLANAAAASSRPSGRAFHAAPAPPHRGGPRMMALATIGFILGVCAFTVGLLLFMIGGPSYRRR